MSHFALAQELIDSIIDLLYDDQVSLKACSITARVFRATSQKHLFARIFLPPASFVKEGNDTSVKKLSNLLQSSPYIQHLICDLDMSGRGYHACWALKDVSDLASILGSVPHLRKLALTGRPPYSASSWASLSHPLQRSLEAVFRSSTIVQLELSKFSDIPFTVLALCSSLRDLTLSHCSLSLTSDVDLAYSHRPLMTPRTRLETLGLCLDLDGLASVVHWLTHPQCALDIHNLRSLAVYAEYQREEHFHIWTLLQACSTTLEEFRFAAVADYSVPDIHPLCPIDLGHHTSLRTLYLELTGAHAPEYNMISQWLCRFLNTIPTKNNLSAIWFSGAFGFWGKSIHRDSWACLDRLLTQPCFSQLKLTHFDMDAYFLEKVAERVTVVESVLPSLLSKDILQVSTSSYIVTREKQFQFLHWEPYAVKSVCYNDYGMNEWSIQVESYYEE